MRYPRKNSRAYLAALLAFCLGLGAGSAARAGSDLRNSANTIASPGAIQQSLQVPLHFERNAGQVDRQYGYLARGRGYGIVLSAAESRISLGRTTSAGQPAVVSMRLAGANRSARATAERTLPGRVNYLVGRDPAKWRTNIQTFGAVRYRDVYPGVDVVYYGDQGQVRYDYVVRPGADPKRIAMAFGGITGIQAAPNGDLILKLASGELRKTKPVVYQHVAGRRVEVAGAFRIASNKSVGFELGAYDRTRPLVIDPALNYATYLGVAGDDYGQAIALDAQNCAYVLGATGSAAFPTTGGSYDTSHNGIYDLFIAKLSPDGKTLLNCTFLGGTGDDQPSAIALRSNGNVVICGDTTSTDFPIIGGAKQAAYGGGAADGFVAELNGTLTALVASTYLGGSGYDTLRGLYLDQINSRVCVAGWTQSTNYPTQAGSYMTAYPAGADAVAVVSVLDPPLQNFAYSTYLGGNVGVQYAKGVTSTVAGEVVVVGRTNSTTFPTTAGVFQPAIKGEMDAFVTKLNAAGSGLSWSSYYGGLWSDGAEAVLIHPQGYVCFVGTSDSNDLPLNGAWPGGGANSGRQDAFFAGFSANGTALHWGTYFGGALDDTGVALCRADNVAVDGTMLIAGETASLNFPVTGDAVQSTRKGTRDAWVMKIQPTGGGVVQVYSSYLGGTGVEGAVGAASDRINGLFVTGWSTSSNFPVTPGAYQTVYGGATEDAFVTHVVVGSSAPTTVTASNATGNRGAPVVLSGTLKRNSDNLPLAMRTLTFKVDGSPVGTGVTNGSGVATFVYNIPIGAALGGHPIVVEFAGDGTYSASSGGATLTVTLITTTTTVASAAGPVGNTVNLSATLIRSDTLAPLAGETIQFKVAGSPVGSAVTNGSGVATLAYQILVPPGVGVHTIDGIYAGAGPYAGSSGTNSLTVSKGATKCYAPDRSGVIGDTITVRGYLYRFVDTVPISGQSLELKVDGVSIIIGTTDGGGQVSTAYVIPAGAGPGTRPISVIYTGDVNYLPSSFGATLTAIKSATKTFTADRTGPLGSTLFLRGYLYRLYDGLYLQGKTLTFKINGSAVGTAVTDVNGRATLNWLATVPPGVGSWSHVVSFPGEPGYFPATEIGGTVTLTRYQTSMFSVARTVQVGQVVPLRAWLKRVWDGAYLPGQTVTFKVGATVLGTGVTDGSGRATLNWTATLPAGSYTLTCEFGGDALYNISSATAPLTVTP